MRVLVFLALSLLPGAALANDTAVGGSGADLVPLSSALVRMKGEDILIRAVGKDWEVEADYVFENLSDKPVKLQVGFPEYACEAGDPGDEHMCDPEPLRFESMRTTVDGQPVEHRKGTLKKGHPWRPRLGQVWLYDVSFEPGRETKIAHRYRVAQGEISDGTAIGTYVTRTGASWAGTIGHARFRIHVPVETRSLFVEPSPRSGGADDLIAATGLTMTTHVVDHGGASTGEILLEARDWEPKTDLFFGFLAKPGAIGMATYDLVESDANKALPDSERCPHIIALWTTGLARAEPNPGDHIPPSPPTEADVGRFVKEGLGNARICSGYVYSMYGKRFDDDALNRYFYGPDGWKPKGWPYGPMQPNPGYSDAMLTPGDRATLELIRRVDERVTGTGSPAQTAAQPAAPAQPATPERPESATPARGCSGCAALGARGAAHGSALALAPLLLWLVARTRRAAYKG